MGFFLVRNQILKIFIDPNCKPILIDESLFNDSDFATGGLVEYSLEGDCLSVQIGLGGCSPDHTIEMVTDGVLLESFPPKLVFKFVDKNPELCLAYFVLERQYDLRAIADITESNVIIEIKDQNKSINYNP